MRILFGLVAAFALAACGDNAHVCGVGQTYSNQARACVDVDSCGPGTIEDPGTHLCVPVCTDGTKLDPSGKCVLDPNDCQDGTVLVNGQCVDPTSGLTIDLDEGATEPNGFGIIESSPAPAGTIVVKPVGDAFVIHGQIKPFQDTDGDGQLDADADTYQLTVSGPTLLEITADGVHGVDGGFLTLANATGSDPLAQWFRFGMNITGDTSQRQVYLPRGGTYFLTIADTRTLFQYSTGGPINAAPGPGDYYITVKQLSMPSPTAVTVTANAGSASGTTSGEVAVYSVPMGTGIGDLTLDMTDVQTAGAIDVLQNQSFRKTAYPLNAGTGNVLPGGTTDMVIAGFDPADQVAVVIDPVWNYATSPASYTLHVRTSDATPLSTTGGTATRTEQQFTDPLSLGQYYLDVGADAQLDGINLSWNHAVTGSLYDGNMNVLARFTAVAGIATWTSYQGLLRFPTAGRYYFLVRDPTGTPGTTQLTATSRIDVINPAAITESTSTGSIAVDPNYASNALTYDAGTDPWQTFDSTGTNTGGQVVSWFDPGTTFGRLDNLVTSVGSSGGNYGGVALQPIFTHTYATGGGLIGRVLLDDPTTKYLVKVNAVGPSSSPTFTLLFDKRPVTDLGMLAANSTPTSSTDHTLGGGTGAGFFLFTTASGNRATITVHPQVSAQLDTQFQRVNADETARGPLVDNPVGDDTETYIQTGKGWTAFVVTSVTPLASAQLYDVSVTVDPPVTYTETTSSATFSSICGGGGGTPIAFVADSIFVSASDNGLSSTTLDAPTGFQMFGIPAPTFRVSTNGWLSFDTTQASSAPQNQDIPDPTAPNNVVAPYWSDLVGVSACAKAVGTTVIVEWDGQDGGGLAVQTQAILDGSNGAITLLWSSAQAALGANATIGIEDAAGAAAKKHSYNTGNAITAGSAKTFSPM